MLFCALLASGRITMRKVDGWQSLAAKQFSGHALKAFLHPSSSSPGSRGMAPNAPKCALIPARKLIRILTVPQ
jgi:hypothetical protein